MKDFKKPFYKVDIARTLRELKPGEAVLFGDEANVLTLRSSSVKMNSRCANCDIKVRFEDGVCFAINEFDPTKERSEFQAEPLPVVKTNITRAEAKTFLGKQLILYRGDREKTMMMMVKFVKHTSDKLNHGEHKRNDSAVENELKRRIKVMKIAIDILDCMINDEK